MKAVLFGALSVFCAASTARALSYADYVKAVWSSSAQLRGRADQRTIAENDRWRRFVPNEPQAFYIAQDNGGWQQLGFILTTPFPGKSFLLMGADAANARAADHELAATKLDLTKAATDAYFECAAMRQTLELHRKNLEDLRTFSRMLDRLYERGESTQAETLAAALQMRNLESELSILEGKEAPVCTKLRAFESSMEPTDLELPRDVPGELLAELGDESSDLRRSRGAIEATTAQIRVSQWKPFPDLQLSAFENRYFVKGSSPVNKPLTYSLQLNVTIPLFFLFDEVPAARREIAEATVQRDQAEIQSRLASSAMRQASAEFRAVSRRIEVLEKNDIPLAEAMMQSSFSSYRAGKLGFAELMLSRRLFSELRDQRVQLYGNRLQLRLKCLRTCESEEPPAS